MPRSFFAFYDINTQFVNKILKNTKSSFQIATQRVLYSGNATQYDFVFNMISSGSLISVRPRFAVSMQIGVLHFAESRCERWEAAPSNRRRRFARKAWAFLEAKPKASPMEPLPTFSTNQQKSSLPKKKAASYYCALSLMKCLVR